MVVRKVVKHKSGLVLAWHQTGYILEPTVGLEPTTYGLQNRCSAIELRRRVGLREDGATPQVV
jgi:hypothetical protein